MKKKSTKSITLFLKGLAMGIADIIPGISGGTIALISGIYKEFIYSLDSFSFSAFKSIRKEGFSSFWKKINGSFLLPIVLGIGTSIVLFSNLVHYLMFEYPIPLWSLFFGVILCSILILLKQNKPYNFWSILFLTFGFMIAYKITQLTPSDGEVSLAYLFFCSMIAIIAMILPGISGSLIYILLGAYETVIHTSKNSVLALINFEWNNFILIYSRLLVIGLGIIIGLKSFTKVLTWLFRVHKQPTLMVLIGFMIGALPKVWPWQKDVAWKTLSNNKKIAIKTEYTTPWDYEGDPQLVIALLLMVLGFLLLFFLEKKSRVNNAK